MTLLDRYILKQFIVNFIMLFSVLFLFYCMIDLFLNLDRFFEATERIYGAEEGTGLSGFLRTTWLVLDFYGPQFFLLYTYLMGLTTIGAMGFTLVQLHRNLEMTAVIAAGVSLHRIVMPLIVAAVALNILQFANRELILPRLAPRLLRTHSYIGAREVSGWRVRLISDSTNNIFYASRFDSEDDSMSGVVMWDFDDEMRLDRVVTAESATWNGGGWSLDNGRSQRPLDDSAALPPPPEPVDAVRTDLDPTTIVLRRYGEYRQMLNLRQIGELIEKPGMYQVGELVRIRFRRFAGFLTNILALLITLPFFMLREPRPLLPQVVKCAALGMVAQIGGAIGAMVALPGIPAAAGVFAIPLLILLPLAALMMSSVDT